MPWLLTLHILALLIWSAGFLYVPAQVRATVKQTESFAASPAGHPSLARFVYTHIATPAALVAITAGTLVFWLHNTVTFWLLAKLALVVGLAALHASLGLLIIRAERGERRGLVLASALAQTMGMVLMILIAWIVLAKPTAPAHWPWPAL